MVRAGRGSVHWIEARRSSDSVRITGMRALARMAAGLASASLMGACGSPHHGAVRSQVGVSTSIPSSVSTTLPSGGPVTSASTVPGAAACPPPAHSPNPSVPICYVTNTNVKLRASPSTTATALGVVPSSTKLDVQCLATGQSVDGPAGPDSTWVKVKFGGATGYVADEFVTKVGESGAPTPPTC